MERKRGAKKKYKDHLGNEYNTLRDMCNKYKVLVSTYRYRRKIGLSVEQALCTKVNHNKYVEFTDKYIVLGKQYHTIAEVCKEYNLPVRVYYKRLKYGLSREEALLKPYKAHGCKDHRGNVFTSTKEMCDQYGIRVTTFKSRIERGWTLEKALEEPTKEYKKSQ